jgi:hypothetical protein
MQVNPQQNCTELKAYVAHPNVKKLTPEKKVNMFILGLPSFANASGFLMKRIHTPK